MPFIFASLNSQTPSTTRKVHIRRLYDVLQLCIHNGDISRARRAWAILVRCKEIDWINMWPTALVLLDHDSSPEFLKEIMLQHATEVGCPSLVIAISILIPRQREVILQELVLRLIAAGKHREALDELELYLPAFPYQDNPVLHLYAGLVTLYLAQPASSESSYNTSFLRDAQVHFEHAKALDKDNSVAQSFIEKIREISTTPQHVEAQSDSDNDMKVDKRQMKRVRVQPID
ncbi:hypothetical protein C8J56DRAFT_542986 [Mycena floridula]|nr:hypothetical protein C8J56DRAFT_542986 [Mycena floridula]